ncbi:MAG: DUF167 domain-containing protein [Candidatus Aenigmatarchaeota archaeon]|nr:MAG: DUF167 domain-containing protein [Candidatus Aenigmarchaeota archaeon]
MSNIIPVKVILNAKRNEIKKENKEFKVYLTSKPVSGKANKLLIEILAKHFKCKKFELKIIRGKRARNKLIQKLF